MIVFIICILLAILVAKLVPGVIGAILTGLFIIVSLIGFLAMFGWNKFAIMFVGVVVFSVAYGVYKGLKESKEQNK